MATRYRFNGAVSITKQGEDELLEFVPISEADRLQALGVPSDDVMRGGCSVEGTPGSGPSGCHSDGCQGTCSLHHRTSGNTTVYWCVCT